MQSPRSKFFEFLRPFGSWWLCRNPFALMATEISDSPILIKNKDILMVQFMEMCDAVRQETEISYFHFRKSSYIL